MWHCYHSTFNKNFNIEQDKIYFDNDLQYNDNKEDLTNTLVNYIFANIVTKESCLKNQQNFSKKFWNNVTKAKGNGITYTYIFLYVYI